jgi:DNA polymerase III delta prime subunit
VYNKHMFDNLWVEKYRPTSINDLLIDESTKNSLLLFKEKKEIPHMLFTSGPGTGKTTTAKIIAKELLNSDYLYINASDENGIDTIRNKVIAFSESKSFDGGLKIIILDEVDGLSRDAQGALRGSMEYYHDTTRCILTANYKNKLIEPLISRIQQFSLTYDKKDVVKLCFSILKRENVIVDKDNAQKMVKLVYSMFPDIRKAINSLQRLSYNGKLEIKSTYADDILMSEVLEFLNEGNCMALRQFLISKEAEFASDYNILLKNLLEYIYKSSIFDSKKKECILIIGEYLYRSVSVIDKEINCFICLIQLSQVLCK